MELLFISSQVESRIAALKKAGKSGKNLAQKATSVIDSIASGDVRCHMDAIESYTKYGENRIKNCRKYDLGCGYRLSPCSAAKPFSSLFLEATTNVSVGWKTTAD